ncbi:MAG: hypothetical protein ACPGVU_23465, partial [Limisphaerales bacterium]
MAIRVFVLSMLAFTLTAADHPSAKQLHALFDREWEYQMKDDPEWASILGDRRWNDQWPDHS